MDFMGFIKSHPIAVTVGVFAVGAMFLLGGKGGGSGDNGAGAFYAAQAMSKQSGDAVMIAQIGANSADKQTLAYLDTQKSINETWSQTQLDTTNANNAAAVTLAPYAAQSNYLATVAQIASQPVQTTTSTKSSSGFFGIGAKTKTSTSVVVNPAWSLLDQFDALFHPAHG